MGPKCVKYYFSVFLGPFEPKKKKYCDIFESYTDCAMSYEFTVFETDKKKIRFCKKTFLFMI